jgi:hypothetical protein
VTDFDCTRAGSMREELVLRKVLASRQRLAASDMAGSLRAWKVWSACVSRTPDWQKGSDKTYIKVIADATGSVKRDQVSALLKEFDRLDISRWTPGAFTRHKPAVPALGRGSSAQAGP